MEDIDKNADGFIDLEEYIGKSVSSLFFLEEAWKHWKICPPIKIICPVGQLLAHH